MTRKATGFTLIELMIVIAIVAILLVIAVPSYREYAIRTRVSEGFKLASTAKLAVAEAATTSGGLPSVTQANSGYLFSAAGTEHVSSIAIANGGAITVTTRQTGASVDPVLSLEPSQAAPSAPLTWKCTATGEARHVPSVCRS